MPAAEEADLVWTKATRSANVADCVEVARAPDEVLVRDSKDPAGTHLAFSRTSWDAFLAGVKAGEFDADPEGDRQGM